MHDYLQHTKIIADRFATSRSPVSPTNLLGYTINKLLEKYYPFQSSIWTQLCLGPILIEELLHTLLNTLSHLLHNVLVVNHLIKQVNLPTSNAGPNLTNINTILN